MNLEEYKQRTEAEKDWAPGWDAIDTEMERLYPGQQGRHYGTDMMARAIFGGDQYLDGYTVYEANDGHLHIVTYGLSELYTNEKAFGGEWSKWGYEMTFRLPMCQESEYMWVIDMLANMARYTFKSKRFLEPLQIISGGGNPIKKDSNSLLTGMIVVNDPDLPGTDTIHGRLDFLQIVGIIQSELDTITKDPAQAQKLVNMMKQNNPMLITDLSRSKSYI